MRILLLSDTHGSHEQVEIPPADVLIHAGDMTRSGTLDELAAFNAFLATLPHPVKLVIAGNRDFCCEGNPVESRRLLTNAIYLEDEEFAIAGLRVYGSPWQPPFLNMAFNLPRGEALREKWDRIPAGVDILVTHTPPMGFGDLTNLGAHVGCEELSAAVLRVRPQVNVYGHIHEGYGDRSHAGIRYINASVMDAGMRVCNPPIMVDLE